MKAILKNRYLTSLVKAILLLVVIHVITLILYTIKTGNYEVLNVFNILGLSYFAPELGKGLQNFIISFILLAIVYGGIFLL